jgi:hypothetical protein
MPETKEREEMSRVRFVDLFSHPWRAGNKAKVICVSQRRSSF